MRYIRFAYGDNLEEDSHIFIHYKMIFDHKNVGWKTLGYAEFHHEYLNYS